MTRIWPHRLTVALVAAACTLGGCSLMFPNKHTRADALSEEQARNQVVEAAQEISRVGHLQDTLGSVSFASCKATNRPPYHAVVIMGFHRPLDVSEEDSLEQITAAMRAHGWDDRERPGERHHGTALHKGDVTAAFTPASPPESRTLGITRTLAADSYTPGGRALRELVRFYWQHPDRRDELTDERGLQRLRDETFETG